MTWCVYILRCKNESFYTGVTTDIQRRFKEHRAGRGGRYTRAHGVVEIVYQERHDTRREAMRREAQVKRWPREKKLALICAATPDAKGT